MISVRPPGPPPFLVVMMMAPAAALEPYRADAAGPFRTLTDSTLFRSISMALLGGWLSPRVPLGPPLVRSTSLLIGIPSTTNQGWLLLVKEVMPRILMLTEAPALPLAPVIFTPETFPSRAFTRLTDPLSAS